MSDRAPSPSSAPPAKPQFFTECPRGCGKRVRWLLARGTGPLTGALVVAETNESHDVCAEPAAASPPSPALDSRLAMAIERVRRSIAYDASPGAPIVKDFALIEEALTALRSSAPEASTPTDYGALFAEYETAVYACESADGDAIPSRKAEAKRQRTRLLNALEQARSSASALAADRPFPIQGKTTHRTIPWWLAEEAYAVYSSDYGTSQSLARLAERGGFSAGELDMFIPGWRDRLDRVKRLESALAEAERELNETTLLLQKVTAALNTALDDETQALFHYQAGYTAGYSHGRRQEPQRGEESARAFVAPRAALAPGHPTTEREP